MQPINNNLLFTNSFPTYAHAKLLFYHPIILDSII